MTKSEARKFLNDQYFKDYCINAGFMSRLLEKYKGNKNKAMKERKRLEKKWDEANEILYEE